MRALLLLAIFICVPSASAIVEGCHADAVCFYESEYTAGSCDTYGWSSAETSIFVADGLLWIHGYEHCTRGGPEEWDTAEGFSVRASTFKVGWTHNEAHYGGSHEETCYTQVLGPHIDDVCPQPSPNPGWGHLLP